MRTATLVIQLGLAGTAMAGAPALPAVAQASAAPAPDRAAIEAAIKRSWTRAAPGWRERLVQDETQRLCTKYRNTPPRPVAEAILAREKAAIVYPADGSLIGDWRAGEKLAQSGYGLRFTDYPPLRENGGNCYACHQLDPNEVSFGTLGPSLAGYGKAHKLSDASVKAVYERIYSPQSAVACSLMPRLGANGVLTPEQIRDLVAYVMSPDSAVNK